MNYKLLGLLAVMMASACVIVKERPADTMPPPQPAPPPAAGTASPTAAPISPPAAAPRQKPVMRTPVVPGVVPVTDAGLAPDAQ